MNRAGHELFEARCAGCHGLDGHGGEHAPAIVATPAAKSRSDRELFNIISNGVVAKGMPSFRALGDQNICALVAHLHALQNTTAVLASGGDPAHGQQLFEGKGGCARCHAMKGSGSFIATDLSDFASNHNASEIRSSILNPGPAGSAAQRSIIAVTSAGDRYSGLVRNENNTSLQIQDAQGNFYLLMKSNLRSIERSSGPQMPVDYQQQLGEKAIEDLVSYIVREASTSKLEAPSTVASNGSGVEEATLSLSMDNAACKNR